MVILAMAGGLAALRLTRHPDYWEAGASIVVAAILPILGKLMRDSSPSKRLLLDAVETELRVAVSNQWKVEVARRISDPYPLPVPFSVLTNAPDGAEDEKGTSLSGLRIMDSWAAIRGKSAARPLSLNGTFDAIEKVFTRRELPMRLVVLGAPGCGKSRIAQWLIVKLLEDGQEKKRVPVFLPMATWNPDTKLEDWVALQMTQTYRWLNDVMQVADGQARTLAEELIAEDRVLMVLDGLDEIAEDNQSRALDKLSEAAREDRHFVVTCRTDDYARIVSKAVYGPLAKTPVVAMGPLPLPHVVQYLKDTVAVDSHGRWSEFPRHLRPSLAAGSGPPVYLAGP